MIGGLRGVLEAGWKGAVGILTPSLCLSCDQPVRDAASLCPSCWAKLRQIDEPLCDRLGTPFAYDEGEGALSAAAIAEPPSWKRARAAVAYDDHSRAIVHALKYGDRQEAGLLMARMMAVAGRRLLGEAAVIVPVPLNRWRLWQRRFNQSAFLAKRLAGHAAKEAVADALLRTKRTRQQVGLDHDERKRNVRGAFAVNGRRASAIAGKHVLLIDDVMTTGATANACADVLTKAGAAQVDVLTFALVLEPRHLHI